MLRSTDLRLRLNVIYYRPLTISIPKIYVWRKVATRSLCCKSRRSIGVYNKTISSKFITVITQTTVVNMRTTVLSKRIASSLCVSRILVVLFPIYVQPIYWLGIFTDRCGSVQYSVLHSYDHKCGASSSSLQICLMNKNAAKKFLRMPRFRVDVTISSLVWKRFSNDQICRISKIFWHNKRERVFLFYIIWHKSKMCKHKLHPASGRRPT